jgi:hypothetical protein
MCTVKIEKYGISIKLSGQELESVQPIAKHKYPKGIENGNFIYYSN